MTADLLYDAIIGAVLFFIALWALLLGIGFVLNAKDDLALAKECERTAASSPSRG